MPVSVNYEYSNQAKYQRRMSATAREIGPLPAILDPERRERCSRDLKLYAETYHAELFTRRWSDDHLKCIDRLQTTVLRGGQHAFAMPRGSGKTTLCLTAAIWSAVYAHRSFIVLIGAEATAAVDMLDILRTDLENNDRLYEDFPEVVHPIRSLDGISHRCNGQMVDGNRTQMTWTTDRVILPTVEGSPSSGTIIRVAGLTGRIRGMVSKTPDGRQIRPDLVIVDDPQTDDSARSLSQNDTRERLLSGAVLNLGGPGESIAAMMPCTVIRSNDMAHRILDRKRHPEWRGETSKLVYAWPTNSKLWEEYAEIWSGELRNDGTGEVATGFYGEHREAMDEGAKVAWEDRYEKGELSAIQHAWNLRLRLGDDTFDAEFQNEPHDVADMNRPITLTSDDLAYRVNKVARGIVPEEFTRVVAFIDISDKVLWWMVCAFDDLFTGAVINYGTWPDQGQRYVRLKAVNRTLQRRYQGIGQEHAILSGLEELVAFLVRMIPGETGTEHHVERILIDEGDGEHTGVVRTFCRRSDRAAILSPAKGRGVKASHKPLCDGRPKPGERFGQYWKLVRNRDQSQTVHVDANYWKTFAMRRFEIGVGDSGSLSIYKQSPRHHQMLADQLTAEIPREIEDRSTGNRVIEWSQRTQRDNHFLDCLSGCCVAASMAGCTLLAQKPFEEPTRKRRRVRYL